MSHAFVKENDDQWLDDIRPTLNALIVYLTHENNSNEVYEKRSYYDADSGTEIHEMSNGISYKINGSRKWEVMTIAGI